MTKILKFIAYLLLFVVSFALFLYWLFPYEVLKDRIVGMIEQQIGSGAEVEIATLSPYWFTGVEATDVKVKNAGGKRELLFECKRAHARASFFSLLFGNPSVSFDVMIGKGEVSGSVQQTNDAYIVDVDADSLDLNNIRLVSAATGFDLSSKIDGSVSLHIDRQNPLRSTGKISIAPSELKSAAYEGNIGGMDIKLPEFQLAKGRDSQIKMEVANGTITVNMFKITGGDLALDIKGKVILSAKAENYRFNLNGSFALSQALGSAIPFTPLFEKEKQADGSYPITVGGRLASPSIKIGNFTVPM